MLFRSEVLGVEDCCCLVQGSEVCVTAIGGTVFFEVVSEAGVDFIGFVVGSVFEDKTLSKPDGATTGEGNKVVGVEA